MNISKERLPNGTLWLNRDDAAVSVVLDFVRSEAFRSVPEDRRVSSNNKKNHIAILDVPGVGKCVLKEGFVSRQYPPAKRLEIAFKLRFLKRGLRTMRLALVAARGGVRTFAPLAFWTDFGGSLRNYFLYRHVEGVPLDALWRTGAYAEADQPALLAYLAKAGEQARKLHALGIVHEDLLPRNIIVPSALDGEGDVSIIDMESASRLFAPGRRLNFTLRLRSLHRLVDRARYDDACLDAFFLGYCGGREEDATLCRRVLEFWRRHDTFSAFFLPIAWLRFPPVALNPDT
ncbi:MAG: lipopolysaccharide kinase InaA family protein [Kiritimatiellia bacterium]